jgi:hypothetical protein
MNSIHQKDYANYLLYKGSLPSPSEKREISPWHSYAPFKYISAVKQVSK